MWKQQRQEDIAFRLIRVFFGEGEPDTEVRPISTRTVLLLMALALAAAVSFGWMTGVFVDKH